MRMEVLLAIYALVGYVQFHQGVGSCCGYKKYVYDSSISSSFM